MNIKVHEMHGIRMAEIVSEGILIQVAQDGLDILGELYYRDFDKIIIREENITPAFFDLKTGLAGEILQKFSNYRVQLAIVGDFSNFQGKSIKDFIYESNRLGQVNFVGSIAEAIERLLKK